MEEQKHLSKKERKVQMKEEKMQQQQIKQKMQRLKKTGVWGGVIIGVVGLIVLIGYAYQQSAKDTPGQQMPDQGRDHIAQGQSPVEYNSTPPTSGPHSTATTWGKHDAPVPYENQIHNLEHGGVIVHYNPDKIQNLAELQVVFDELNNKYPKMVLVPDSEIETTYSLTGWRWIDTFNEYDPQRIRLFVKKRYNVAPEPNAN